MPWLGGSLTIHKSIPTEANLHLALILMPNVTRFDKNCFLLQVCNKKIVTNIFVTKYLLQLIENPNFW
jgi:hypothetical protein